jgi:hypothetical protein
VRWALASFDMTLIRMAATLTDEIMCREAALCRVCGDRRGPRQSTAVWSTFGGLRPAYRRAAPSASPAPPSTPTRA